MTTFFFFTDTKISNIFSSLKSALTCASFLCLMLLLSACPQQPTIDSGPYFENGIPNEAVWKKFQENSAQAKATTAPFLLVTTVNYLTPDNKGHRVLVSFWGNDILPIRADAVAGIGADIAHIYEDKKDFTFVALQEKVVYTNFDRPKPLFNLGVPLPFRLEHVVALANGRFDHVFPSQTFVTGDKTRYQIKEPYFNGIITLSQNGLPVLWEGPKQFAWPKTLADGWSMELFYNEKENKPRRLVFKHTNGTMVNWLIKERHQKATYTNEQMDLIIPPGFPLLSFEKI